MTIDPNRRATLQRLSAQHRTPFFAYFLDDVRQRVTQVRRAFADRFQISFAVKSNPNLRLLERLHGIVDCIDVSSAGEVHRGIAAGWKPELFSFTGPGKTAEELADALDAGTGEIVLESVDEATTLSRIARERGSTAAVLIRIAPANLPRGFGVSMSGRPTQFGIDEEDLDAAIETIHRLPHLDLRGFHIYAGTQCLRAEAIAETYGIYIEIFRRAASTHQIRPKRLIFGSGIGVPYYDKEEGVDLKVIADGINPTLATLRNDPWLGGAELALETGRYLVGEAGIYVTKVVRTKHSRGADYAILDGGMNHHLGAAGHLGTVIPRNYRIFRIDTPSEESEGSYELVGPLCTTIDTLGRQVKLAKLAPGAVLGIHCSGAYGPTASPINFISHRPPTELIVETIDGVERVEDVTPAPRG